MARKTKEDALATRHRLLDAAEEVFYARGVAGASLTDIAQVAGLTRGAIYWHFKDKMDLFDAMMQRAILPLEQAIQQFAGTAPGGMDASPLDRLLVMLGSVLRIINDDVRMRRVFEITRMRTDFVGEQVAVRHRRMDSEDRFIEFLAYNLTAAFEFMQVGPVLQADHAARGLYALLDGVLHAWLLREADYDLEAEGMALLRIYLRGLGLSA